ncbi:ABC transporter ATP-binding protein [Weissella cibaria]|uniref:ABC transporter ATP-binding protein n=1 Tax=Weissella cibaria TaxID=137591 RepID=UPI001CD68F9B|nr:ABC transporter ATP-binding protein [Weissella cibaria]MCA1355547.1 ABC transporter ATP-binding protein [Weissella cibaria]MDQ2125543.1 ABC transporter ATP-binding protein [Weissella cibaria]MDQ2157704.1 ABC transporter ATP-binding protein [Weissella cibaria]
MLIQLKGLTKKIKDKSIVNQVNLEIEKGQFVALLGTNGAGKSTTIKMILGLLAPTNGEVISQLTRPIGVVFQQSILDSQLTVEMNLDIRKAIYPGVEKEWLQELLHRFKLPAGLMQKKYGVLSGGEKRKVDVVRALLGKPELLILDEPTTGLDIQTRKLIWRQIHELRGQMGLAVLLTTHYLEEAEDADFVYMMQSGQVTNALSRYELKSLFMQRKLVINFADGKTQIFDQVEPNNVPRILGAQEKWVDFDYRPVTMDDIFVVLTKGKNNVQFN